MWFEVKFQLKWFIATIFVGGQYSPSPMLIRANTIKQAHNKVIDKLARAKTNYGWREVHIDLEKLTAKKALVVNDAEQVWRFQIKSGNRSILYAWDVVKDYAEIIDRALDTERKMRYGLQDDADIWVEY